MAKKIYIWQNPKWPDFSWDDTKILAHLSLARKMQGQILEAAAEVGLETQAQILTEDTQKTAAIEGDRLDRNSIRSSVARRLGLSTEGLPIPPRPVDGLVEMLLDATQNYKKDLTKKRLKGWQAGLFPTGHSGIHQIQVGQWRDSEEPMRVISGSSSKQKIHFEAPPSKNVSKEMTQFLDWFQDKKNETDGLIRAAIAHLWFVTIHPFDDGNGRIARAITDLALAQDESFNKRCYSLSAQISHDRKDYYEILESTQKGSLDVTDWIIWFLQTLAKAIEASMALIQKAKLVGNFWKTHSHLELNTRQRKVLQKMLETEPDGFLGGMTNKKYVSITRTSRETAKRDLSDLVEKKLLRQNEGKGRSISYSLVLKF